MSSEPAKKATKLATKVAKNYVNAVTSPYKAIGDMASGKTNPNDLVKGLADRYDPLELTGNRSPAQILAAGLADTTPDDFQDASSNGLLDQITKREVATSLQNGDSKQAASILSDAKAGKGIYAVRRINENQSKLLDMRPGRSQLSSRYAIINPIDL